MAGRPLGSDDAGAFRDEADPYQAFVRGMSSTKATGPAKPMGNPASGAKPQTPQQRALILAILQMLMAGKR